MTMKTLLLGAVMTGALMVPALAMANDAAAPAAEAKTETHAEAAKAEPAKTEATKEAPKEAAAAPAANGAKAFSSFDADNNGAISEEEFLNHRKDMKIAGKFTPEQIAERKKARFKEIDTNVTVTCREGISRRLNPFKPACDKPTREKEKVPVGFMADITAREASDDKFAVSVDGSYVQVLEEQKLKLGDTELESASFRIQSLNSSMVVMANSEVEIANGIGADEIKLKVKVQRL